MSHHSTGLDKSYALCVYPNICRHNLPAKNAQVQGFVVTADVETASKVRDWWQTRAASTPSLVYRNDLPGIAPVGPRENTVPDPGMSIEG